MWPIKTKAEIHADYMAEIERLEGEIESYDLDIGRINRKKDRNAIRIAELKETAKLFE